MTIYMCDKCGFKTTSDAAKINDKTDLLRHGVMVGRNPVWCSGNMKVI